MTFPILLALMALFAALAVIPADIADTKGHSFWGWWWFGFLLFIPALICAVVIQPTSEVADQRLEHEGYVKCPECAEYIRPDARICRFCQSPAPTETVEV